VLFHTLKCELGFYKPILSKVSKALQVKIWFLSSSGWFRSIAYVRDPSGLKSRNGRELIHNFPEILELTQLRRDKVVDCEIVILRGRGGF
jgi:hypothetical protein